MSALPLREELRGIEPYGAPQLDVPVQLNVNENPYPPSEKVVAEVATAVADATRTLNRYPDREFTALREDLAGYLGHGITADQVWAANGSNEVMPRDPEYLSYALAATCLLTLQERQSLLEAETSLDRLIMLRHALMEEMRAMRAIPSLPATQVARTSWSPN